MGDTIMSDLTNEHIQMIQRAQRWKMAFFGIIILLAGVIIGAGSALILKPAPKDTAPSSIEFMNKRIIRNLQKDLNLKGDQAREVTAIVEKHLGKLHEIRQQARPKMAEIMDALHTEVLTVLDENQKEKWQQSIERLSDSFTKGGHGQRGRYGGGKKMGHGGPGRRGGGQMAPGGGGFGGPGGGPGSMRGPGGGRNRPHRPFDSWGPPSGQDGYDDSMPYRRKGRSQNHKRQGKKTPNSSTTDDINSK